MLKDPQLLILDEATSALDSESEHLVQEALDRLMKGRTSVVIAHRLSTIRKAHQIIVLDDGAVIESGTHEELMQKTGTYAELIKLQDVMGRGDREEEKSDQLYANLNSCSILGMMKQILKHPAAKILLNKYFLTGISFVIWMIFLDTNNYFIHAELTAQIDDLENDIEFYEEALELDKTLLEQLVTDPEAFERYARENFGMHREGEDITIIEFESSKDD